MVRDDIAVIIPCYNEALTIGKVVDDFHRELPEATVYVYDNNSTDGTAEIARGRGAVVRHESRQGKGNVCRQMFRDIDADCYLMVGGDDTYPAESPSASMPAASSNQSRRLRHEPSQPSSNPKEGTSFSVTPPKSSKNLPGSPRPSKPANTFSR